MHGSEDPGYRRTVSRLAGPRTLEPHELARRYHETKVALAESEGFLSAHLQPWTGLGEQRRRLELAVAEALLEGPIAEHVQAASTAAAGPAKLSTPVAGVCREFLDVEVRDAVMAAAGAPEGEATFNAALRTVLLERETLRAQLQVATDA
jgi:hypothetical protein